MYLFLIHQKYIIGIYDVFLVISIVLTLGMNLLMLASKDFHMCENLHSHTVVHVLSLIMTELSDFML